MSEGCAIPVGGYDTLQLVSSKGMKYRRLPPFRRNLVLACRRDHTQQDMKKPVDLWMQQSVQDLKVEQRRCH
jgi:hypothetical protein